MSAMTREEAVAELLDKARRLQPETGLPAYELPVSSLIAHAFIDAVNAEWDALYSTTAEVREIADKARELARAASAAMDLDKPHFDSSRYLVFGLEHAYRAPAGDDKTVPLLQWMLGCAKPLWAMFIRAAAVPPVP